MTIVDGPIDPIGVDERQRRIIEGVQRRLLELGYSGGGAADGFMGKRTEGSILNFRNRNGLPLVPVIDDELLAALTVANKVERPIEQTEATVSDIAPKVEAVQKTWWAKAWAWIMGLPAFLGTLFLGIVENLGDAIDKISPLKQFLGEFLSSISPLTMVLMGTTAVTIVSFIIWWQAKGAETALVDGYQRGTVRNDNKEEAAMDSGAVR